MGGEQRKFWQEMVVEYEAVSKKIRDMEVRISQGNLLSTSEGVEFKEMKATRDRLIWSMGVEFPNLYSHHNRR